MTSAAVTVRCEPCHHVRHDQCLGRQFCSCLICHKRAIIADAQDRAARGDRLMAELVAINTQRVFLATKIRSAPSRYFGGCHCGCGEAVYGSAFGAPKRYVNLSHRRHAEWLRFKARRQEAA